MTELSVVGQSVVRIDALEKVLGKASYYSDIKLPGMLHMKVLRSPYSHAKILNIDTSEAARLPGVRCVVTDKDAPQLRWSAPVIKDRTVLARDVVRYTGEPVAAVAADTMEIAERATELIKVKYEVLPAVFDAEEAMSENPPAIVHPDFATYFNPLPDARREPKRPNVFVHVKARKGNVQAGFEKADFVLENRFSTQPMQHACMEPRGVVVRPEPDGGLTLWTGRQFIWELRGQLAEIYGISPSKIRIIQQYVGGGFGGKKESQEIIPALVALKTGRPVQWVATREEEFIHSGHRQATVVYIKDAVKNDGTLLAREVRAILNCGAYENMMSIVTRSTTFATIGSYRTPNLKFDAYGVYTNEPPASPFRGFGIPEVIWATESHMDMLAEKLGIDPVEMKRKNVLKEGEPNITGEITHSIGAEECLEKMDEFLKQGKKSAIKGPWRKGKGIALGTKFSAAPTVSAAKVKVTEEGKIVLYHSAEELGQGCNTVLAQIVAEEFGVSVDDVITVASDTLLTPYFGGGSTSSRTTFQLGNAIRLSCQNAKRTLFEKAAEQLGVTSEELETKDKVIYSRVNPDKRLNTSELFIGYRGKAASLYGGTSEVGEILGSATYIQDFAPENPETFQIDPLLASQGKRIVSFFTHTAKAVELDVNVETGQVKVSRCAAATDLGKMINPKMCEQQSEGGIAMGISSALHEGMIMDKGTVINPSFTDYKIISMADMPLNENVKSVFVESAPHKDGPFGAKGFSEAVMVGMESAIGNAVYNAVGVRIKDLPITPEKVLKALKEKSKV